MVRIASHCAGSRLSPPPTSPSRAGPSAGRAGSTSSTSGIIEALQANSRESFRRIAERLGVSEATVRARYTRLSEDEILQVVGVTNPLGLGFEQALICVKTAGSPQPVADEIARWTEADYVVVTAGQYDLVVEVVAADRRGLLEITTRMRQLEGVVSTETFLYLDLVQAAVRLGNAGGGDGMTSAAAYTSTSSAPPGAPVAPLHADVRILRVGGADHRPRRRLLSRGHETGSATSTVSPDCSR